MFVIMHSSGLYFHNKGRIILFETEQEAQNFLQMFNQYSVERLAQSEDMGAIMQAQIEIAHNCRILPVNFDINTVECGTVFARELFENARRR